MKKQIINLAIVIFSSNFLLGQEYYFKHYKSENGLSHNTVLSSLQDKTGFLWFGTKDGLNRFDGYNFKVFRNDPKNINSIGSNFIECLHEFQGELWVGTDNGLYKYNESLEDFKLLESSFNKPILDIENDENGNLWFVAESTLYRYNIASGKTISYKTMLPTNIEEITRTEDGTIWLGFNNNLYKYHKENDVFSKIEINIETKNKLPVRISKILGVDNDILLIGTQNNGALAFDVLKNVFNKLSIEQEEPLYVRDFLKTDSNEIWIATESGLFIYNLQNATSKNLIKNYNNPYALSDNAIYTFTKDTEGGIWIGSYFGGINYYPKQFFQFDKYFPKLGENSLSGNAVREIQSDDHGNLWIGTEDAGLNKFNPDTGIFTNYIHSKKPSTISHNNIHGLYLQENKLWIGTFEHGIDVMDIKSGNVIKHYNVGDGHGLSSNFVYTFYHTKQGELFIVNASGIQTYSFEKDTFTLFEGFPNNVFYTSLIEDHNGILWAGTYWDGLISFNPKTKKKMIYKYSKENQNSISNNAINGIFKDSKNNLWVTTENGLNVYDYKKNEFKNYSTKDGFPSNVFYAIIEDNENTLWISTSKGLVKFNPELKEIKVFTTANGLLNNQFNYNSAFKDNNGTIYLGSVNGMIRFNPNKFLKNTFKPPILITGLEIVTQETPLKTNIPNITNSIPLHKELTLQPYQNSFNLDFTTLSYTSPEMTEYWYKLEGLSSEWISIQKRHKVYFTGLASGEYLFRIKALNSNGIWSEQETPLKITILPPLWKSNMAYAFYFGLATLFVFLSFRYYHRRVKAKNRHLIKELNNKKEKELYHAKIEFFTNVSHEIRTPLSLIKIPLEKLLKKQNFSNELVDQLSIMHKNVERLLNLVNQLLDFRKTEIESVSLTFVKTNITELIKETYIRFSQTIENDKLNFELKLEAHDVYAYVDHEALKKILSNLFNNAIKNAKKQIHLSLSVHDETLTIVIKNDGNLIPPHLRNKIFEPFFSSNLNGNQKLSGTGIGLTLSNTLVGLHKGSLRLDTSDATMNNFELKLPIHQEKEFHFYNSQKLDVIKNTGPSFNQITIENSKQTILLVEDNEDLLDFIAKDLINDYAVIKATNADKALEIINNENIQLVISDVMMPGTDGFVFCEKIKTNIETSHIPIILLTAKTTFGAKIAGLESGADAFIEKPFSMEHLKVQVSNLLENRKNIMDFYSSSPLAHIRSMAHTSIDENFIKKLDGIIINNVSDSNLGVEFLAEHMNMSRSTLYRKINSISNLSPNELINITRLKKAAELLKTGRYKIYEVADMVGFNSQVSFGRSFQRQFNMTPSEYLKSGTKLI
ncbi:MAG: response regulator [Flavobacteriales bacterium]|nr:response regulator [Flavobacteriales bacterium]NCQ11756.1 response regulator [Bacteroidota bacterium]PIV92964.1 MAG: hybrid sensor histidine kinase/response regulator [Flavobacteriaceae bacterium CG17_big_fil_post_rev_8_21_14_2_50_33_15]NCP59853.1 response regulator [Flavobacteriales bacterium]NCQ58102.1 response regulator [Flavobacteriales bacterium]